MAISDSKKNTNIQNRNFSIKDLKSLLDVLSDFEKKNLEKIKARLKSGYYNKEVILNKIAQRVNDSLLLNTYQEKSHKKSKSAKIKYSMAKNLVEEFYGIWSDKEPEKSSIEVAKELRIRANSRIQ